MYAPHVVITMHGWADSEAIDIEAFGSTYNGVIPANHSVFTQSGSHMPPDTFAPD